MTARVVCVIPCFNSVTYLASAVQSVLDQTYADCRAVVVDDGSEDRFEEAIAPFERRVQVIRQPHRGVSAARNAALLATDSEFVAYLDADDCWTPMKLAIQLRYLQDRPRIGIVHTGVEFIDDAGDLLDVSRPEYPPGERIGMMRMIKENLVCTSSVVQRRQTFDGEFFHRELVTCEDWDLWLRIARQGYSSGYIREPLTQYRMHSLNASRRADAMLEGTVTTMNRLLTRERRKVVRRAAVRRRDRAFCDLANRAYSRGDLKSARRFFTEGLRSARPAELRRLLQALVPPLYDLATWVRSSN